MAVSRFAVMAILQAARAEALGLPRDSALSWGLNRAIFYAAAKRGFKGGSPASGRFRRKEKKSGEAREATEDRDVFNLGDEMAFKEEKDGKLYFKFGGEVQTEKNFERQVSSRFAGDTFKEAWNEAKKIVAGYDRDTLLSQRRFFDSVYKPRRDILAKQWTELSASQSTGPVKKERKKVAA
jgi:hypothetical protein